MKPAGAFIFKEGAKGFKGKPRSFAPHQEKEGIWDILRE